jgi:sugar/nucleoside kinase (ribokinase family)
MTDEPAPPESFGFGDAERELWRRVMALPWVEPIDSMAVSLLILASRVTRRLVDAIADAKASGEPFTFDPDEAIADQLAELDECLDACLISRPLARRFGLWPMGLADDEAAAPRRKRTLRRLSKRQTAELVAFSRQAAARLRQRAAFMRQAAERDPSSAEMLREMAESSERTADRVEKDLEDL